MYLLLCVPSCVSLINMYRESWRIYLVSFLELIEAGKDTEAYQMCEVRFLHTSNVNNL